MLIISVSNSSSLSLFDDGFNKCGEIHSKLIAVFERPGKFEEIVRRAITNMIGIKQRTELRDRAAKALNCLLRV